MCNSPYKETLLISLANVDKEDINRADFRGIGLDCKLLNINTII